ncbi:MAG: RNA ligase [Candidatus Micrarchaeota archaeon]
MQRILAEALKRGKAERKKEALGYIRFRERFKKIERGTVIVGKRIIWGFPHIKRIFALGKGLPQNLDAAMIYAEEKIDGFNVRIAWIDGEVFAFSRGGFLDSFVTEKARDAGLERYFRKHPEHVLCAEMIGNTPYTRPSKEFDTRLFVFDIDEGDGTYLPPGERYRLLDEFGIESAPRLGKFIGDDIKGISMLAVSLNKSRKEGMVLKSDDREKVVKYVTPWSDLEDIADASDLFFDMPIGFYYQRILRSAFFISEFGLDREEYSKKLGKAFYDGLMSAISRAREREEIADEFEIVIRERGIWDDIRRHMGKEVKVEELWRREEGKSVRIRFRKIYRKTSSKLMSYAAGKGVTD